MIRKMKKLSLFVFHEDKEKTLKDLASLGLVHIEIANGVSSDNIENIASKKNEAIRAKSIINLALSEAKKLKKDTSNLKAENTSKKALEVIENILSISQTTDKLKTEREILKKELSIIAPFGNFSFDKIKELQEKTEYNILFYSSTIREFNDYDFSSLKEELNSENEKNSLALEEKLEEKSSSLKSEVEEIKSSLDSLRESLDGADQVADKLKAVYADVEALQTRLDGYAPKFEDAIAKAEESQSEIDKHLSAIKMAMRLVEQLDERVRDIGKSAEAVTAAAANAVEAAVLS